MSRWLQAFAEADFHSDTPVPKLPICQNRGAEEYFGNFGKLAQGAESENEVDDITEADRDDDWAERAAIAEYDGKLHRSVAEQVADACHPATLPKAEPDDWPAWFEGEIAKRAPALGAEAARRRVVGKALSLWRVHHSKRGEPGRCAGCGESLPPSEAFTLGDGATIHAYEGFVDYLIGYGSRWRSAALEGLRRLGVPISEADL